MTVAEYNQTVKQHADGVYRFIFKNLQSEDDSKDVIQSAFEKLWIHRLEVEVEKAKSYLFTVAYRLMIDFIRKQKRVFFNADAEFSPTYTKTTETAIDQKRILQIAFEQLNEQQRSLLMLKDYEGYSYEEIGKIMQLSASQVKVYLHRARQILKNFIVCPENV